MFAGGYILWLPRETGLQSEVKLIFERMVWMERIRRRQGRIQTKTREGGGGALQNDYPAIGEFGDRTRRTLWETRL